MMVFIGAILLDGSELIFSKSADFKAADVETEMAMYDALINLFTQAADNLETPADELKPAAVQTVADHAME
jgi:hypothetical protein